MLFFSWPLVYRRVRARWDATRVTFSPIIASPAFCQISLLCNLTGHRQLKSLDPSSPVNNLHLKAFFNLLADQHWENLGWCGGPWNPSLCPVPSASLCTCARCVLFLSIPPSLSWGRARRGVSECTSRCRLWPPRHMLSLDPGRQAWKRTDSWARCGLGEETQLFPCDAACLLSWKPKPLSFEGPIKVQDIISALSGRHPTLPRRYSSLWVLPSHPSLALAEDDSLCDHKSPFLSTSWPPPLWKWQRDTSQLPHCLCVPDYEKSVR